MLFLRLASEFWTPIGISCTAVQSRVKSKSLFQQRVRRLDFLYYMYSSWLYVYTCILIKWTFTLAAELQIESRLQAKGKARANAIAWFYIAMYQILPKGDNMVKQIPRMV